MKQILQSLKTGRTEVAEVPAPACGAGQVLVRTSRSLISAGTERMLVEFGRANLIEKARQQPDKVRMALDKARADGVLPTIEAIRNKLDQPVALGYCNAGTVIDTGGGVTGFQRGDRVASNAKHAEFGAVPMNLCARIPDGVSDDAAAFTAIGAIALQGIRLAAPTLGECVAVTGLGLVGLMAVQLLKAQGCRVLGLDFARDRLDLARRFGADVVDLKAGQDPVATAAALSRGRGVDAVLIATATQSSEVVHQAALMCRKRGRIVLVGVAGLELSRADFYEKELTFQVSCSYGPGRYDPNYEEKGQDYPVGYVRWTEQRNFEAVLDMMAAGSLDVGPLISHRFPIASAEKAYELISGSESSLGVLIEYPDVQHSVAPARTVRFAAPRQETTGKRVSFVGTGNYATAVLIPAFKQVGAEFRIAASAGGVSATLAARKFGFAEAATDPEAALHDPKTDAVVIATRHNSHAELVLAALAAGKHVFVEKPLCLTQGELTEIEAACRTGESKAGPPMLMVGFNRRFAPQVEKMKVLLAGVAQPKSLVMTVNAGAIPAGHWTHDRTTGGGRIVGEACHFVDLLRHLVGHEIARAQRITMEGGEGDTVSLQLGFADGSIGTVHYFSNGHKAVPKERLDVFAAGRILTLSNFRKLSGAGWPGFARLNLWRQDKGQKQCAAAFLHAVATGGPPPIPLEEIFEVARVSMDLAQP